MKAESIKEYEWPPAREKGMALLFFQEKAGKE
jgi:hypothetical protein